MIYWNIKINVLWRDDAYLYQIISFKWSFHASDCLPLPIVKLQKILRDIFFFEFTFIYIFQCDPWFTIAVKNV